MYQLTEKAFSIAMASYKDRQDSLSKNKLDALQRIRTVIEREENAGRDPFKLYKVSLQRIEQIHAAQTERDLKTLMLMMLIYGVAGITENDRVIEPTVCAASEPPRPQCIILDKSLLFRHKQFESNRISSAAPCRYVVPLSRDEWIKSRTTL